MLGPEHVRAKRRGEKLTLPSLSKAEQALALELAEQLLTITEQSLGLVREEVEEAWDSVVTEPKAQKICEGLRKLVDDACSFGAELESDPRELRKAVFEMASAARKALGAGEHFSREAILAEVAAVHGVSAEALERGLYADLKGAQRLEKLEKLSPQELVERYERGQLQAALLRAVRVTLVVRCGRPEGYRQLFHKLKFRRLLHSIERLADGRYRIQVDGPFSLFESVTKYGLQLALLVPALHECDEVELEADLRWGAQRKPILLVHSLRGAASNAELGPRDDVADLLDRLDKVETPWKARSCSDVLDLPGAGLCVPDLVFERKGRRPVYVEVLGFWSREAVWKRVELAEKGLGERVVFAVSSKLRVSEAVLDDDASAALYVYKVTLNPKALLERVERLAK
jgi:predicted nuclease of restriction endonuclease-like RecB superfamily